MGLFPHTSWLLALSGRTVRVLSKKQAMESSCCGAPDPRLSTLTDFPLRRLPLGLNVEEKEGAVFGLDCTANLSNHQREGTTERDRVKHERKREINGQTGRRV
ncbi:uncharacterized [Tachysurus ichikawai]